MAEKVLTELEISNKFQEVFGSGVGQEVYGIIMERFLDYGETLPLNDERKLLIAGTKTNIALDLERLVSGAIN